MSGTARENFLNAIATDVSVAQFTQAIAEHPEWMPTRAPDPAAAPVPTAQLDPVLQMSGLSAEQRDEVWREARHPALGVRIAAHDAQVAANLVDSTLSTQQAADLLGRDPSNIRRGIQERRYYAVRVAGRLRLPAWQFIGQPRYDHSPGEDAVPETEYLPVPNLSTVVPAIPPSLHPQTIAGFMQTPQPELDDTSPIDWLTGGGDPVLVSSLLDGFIHQ